MKNLSKKTTVVITVFIVIFLMSGIFIIFDILGVVKINSNDKTKKVVVELPSVVVKKPVNPVVNQIAGCQKTLTASATSLSGSIATGTILVTFNPSVSFATATAILSSVGASVSPITSQSLFLHNHLIQASVASQSEIFAICTLRATSTVHYAGFDQLFFLHP